MVDSMVDCKVKNNSHWFMRTKHASTSWTIAQKKSDNGNRAGF